VMQEPSWLSVLPPFVAIVTTLLTKRVVLLLFAGIWLGIITLNGGQPISSLADSVESMGLATGRAKESGLRVVERE
jgi:tetracycline resistance efflux pump